METGNVIDGQAVPVNKLNLTMLVRIPAVRQMLLLIGVAAAVATGFVVASWSQQPAMTMLYTNIESAEAADIVGALRAANIEYELNARTGDILVPESKLHDARLELASQGFGDAATAGMEGLNEQSSFGTSQFMETARYQHALEAELARTISSLGAVREARVHLALPKRTAFIRDQKASSASVLLHLYRGQSLEADQAAAIVNLVAASVPDLKPGEVTLVDQFGSLLSSSGQQLADAQATSQFKYTRRLEETYKRRIEDLLTPLLGPGRIRAEVVADIDFTYVEETRESFDPSRTVVRSERLDEDLRTGAGGVASGVPGALSNQPPEAGGVDANAEAEATTEESLAKNTSRSSVRNYEVDRTISLTRPQSNTIRRLSVAVLVDESPVDDSTEARTLTDEELERYTAVVREAVGFNAARGDSVVVLGQPFLRIEDPVSLEEPPIWQRPFVKDAVKQVLGALIVLAIAFGVVRPMLRSVVASGGAAPLSGEYLGGGHVAPMPSAAGDVAGSQVAMPNYNEKVAAAKNLTGHDPARVAQVVKQWVANSD